MVESDRHGPSLAESMICLRVLGRRHVPGRPGQPALVQPANPSGVACATASRVLPPAACRVHLGQVEADEGLGEGVVAGVARAADLGQPGGIY